MTVPVSTRVTTSEETVTEEMGFYVPTEHQAAAPVPMDNTGVKIVTRPEMVAFVRKFGGYAKDADWTEQRDSLIKELKTREDADTIDFDSYYRCGSQCIKNCHTYFHLDKGLTLHTSFGDGRMRCL